MLQTMQGQEMKECGGLREPPDPCYDVNMNASVPIGSGTGTRRRD
jgi:hypothetical protein